MGTFATVLVILMAAMVLGHALVFAFAMIRLERRLGLWAEQLAASQAAVGRTLRVASELLARVGQVTAFLPALEKHTVRLLDAAGSKAGAWDQAAARGLAKATEAVEATSRRLEYGLTHFSRQTTILTRKARIPILHFSAIIRGIAVGVETWRQGRRSSPLMDEESFI